MSDDVDKELQLVTARVDSLQSDVDRIDRALTNVSAQQVDATQRLSRMESHIDMILREVHNVRADAARWAQSWGEGLHQLTAKIAKIDHILALLLTIVIGANLAIGLLIWMR